MRGRTQSPPGARVGAGWLRGRTHHWRLDISTRWFAGAQRRASRERGVARKNPWVRPICYLGVSAYKKRHLYGLRKSADDHHAKKQRESNARTAESSSAFPSCEPSDPFSVAGTSMVRRATFNLLVQLRRRTSRPYSLELEHADARRFSTRCCLERRASPTPLASTTHTAMIWMI